MDSTSLAGVPELPDDVLLSIFHFLPVPDLARCAAVCERWHVVVTGYTHLWQGKEYCSYKSPSESAETHAVLRALPPLQVADVEVREFHLCISYPYLSLSVADISDLTDCRRLECTSLSVVVHIADVVFSPSSPVSFAALEKLQIVEGDRAPDPDTGATERAVETALKLCPNLGELSVRVDSLSADRLDALQSIGRLRTLEIFCYRLEKLAFLRHCSDTLEELELECCCQVPPATFAELGHLGKLRRLWLRDCRVADSVVEAAAPGLRSLESLQLDHCHLLSDLSSLRHCGRLRELRVVRNVKLLSGLRRLPAGVRSLCLAYCSVDPDELSEALARLPRLEELSLSGIRLGRLGFLRHCRRLRRFCLDDAEWPAPSELSNFRHAKRLETLELMAFSIDVDTLLGVVARLDGRSPPCDGEFLNLLQEALNLPTRSC